MDDRGPDDLRAENASTRWRQGTTTGRWRFLVVLTAAWQIAIGLIALGIAAVAAGALAGPFAAALVWLVPTVLVTYQSLRHPVPGRLDDDNAWNEHVLSIVLVGAETPRSVPMRFVIGMVFGAPLGWYVLLSALMTALPIG